MFPHVAQAPEGGYEVRKDNFVGKHSAEVSIVTEWFDLMVEGVRQYFKEQ